MVDYRKLLKDAIRGEIFEADVPTLPVAPDDNITEEEVDAFFALAREVHAEIKSDEQAGEADQAVLKAIDRDLRELERMRREEI